MNSNQNIDEFRKLMKNKQNPESKQKAKIKNRRFMKLQELIEHSDYFSEVNIKMRHPLIYHMYIGRFERNEHSGRPQALMMTDIAFQRLDAQTYESLLTKAK